MENISVQLDNTVLQIFQVLENLYTKQDSLQQVMKDGFFGISRSRYMLGVKWVSLDQILDADLAAKYKTIIDSSVSTTDNPTLNAVEKSLTASEADSLTLFKLTVTDDVYLEKLEDSKEIPVDTDNDKQTGLRKRHPDSENVDREKIQENVKEQGSIIKNDKKEDENQHVKAIKSEGRSSLSLFGVLAPRPLRSSQKCFEESVKIAVSIADLKLKLSLLQSEYKRLYKIKESLLVESDEK
uniref:Vacuolar ATPase assembly protein VMA22 n=1 Tax=Arion vulgaris TaxID=1028688 RepID=A0A0B7A542_9EUPU